MRHFEKIIKSVFGATPGKSFLDNLFVAGGDNCESKAMFFKGRQAGSKLQVDIASRNGLCKCVPQGSYTFLNIKFKDLSI